MATSFDGPVCFANPNWYNCIPLKITEFDSLERETVNIKWYLSENSPPSILVGAKSNANGGGSLLLPIRMKKAAGSAQTLASADATEIISTPLLKMISGGKGYF